jgi:hypothetical protein
MLSVLRKTVVASLTITVLGPMVAFAQSDLPFHGEYAVFVDNESTCGIRFPDWVDNDGRPRAMPGRHAGAFSMRDSYPIPGRFEMNGGVAHLTATRRHLVITIREGCQLHVAPIDAHTAEARFRAELAGIHDRGSRWRRRGAIKIFWGTLLTAGGVAGIASGSNAGVGAGFAAVGVGLATYAEASGHYRRARPTNDEYNRQLRLRTWLQVLEQMQQ